DLRIRGPARLGHERRLLLPDERGAGALTGQPRARRAREVESAPMALSGLGLFLLEACAGIGLLLLLFPPATLGKGFFSLRAGVAAAFAILAVAVRPPGMPPVV